MDTAVKNGTEVAKALQQKELRAPAGESSLSLNIKRHWFRLTHWETWDWRLKYLLIAPAWLWLCLRARSFWFFTASNPTLTFGGFEGESKSEMYAQLPPGSYPKSIFITPGTALEEVIVQLKESGIEFPLAVKPDVGKMGLMFRRITSAEELRDYHERMRARYIAQEFVSYPLEVSVFYYRMPDAITGNITGFIYKDFLEVTGDGHSTLWQLITRCQRAQFRLKELRAKHREKLHSVIASGERFCLSPALNLSRGGKLVSLEHKKDERLLKVFDDISHHTGAFYYGRYDVRCRSIEALKEGKDFLILEYNGSGAEPHHVYGNGYSLWEACSILVRHWNLLFKIATINSRKGIAYWSFARGWKFLKQAGAQIEELRRLDSQFPVR